MVVCLKDELHIYCLIESGMLVRQIRSVKKAELVAVTAGPRLGVGLTDPADRAVVGAAGSHSENNVFDRRHSRPGEQQASVAAKRKEKTWSMIRTCLTL